MVCNHCGRDYTEDDERVCRLCGKSMCPRCFEEHDCAPNTEVGEESTVGRSVDFTLFRFTFNLAMLQPDAYDQIARCILCREQLLEGDPLCFVIGDVERVVGQRVSFSLQMAHLACGERRLAPGKAAAQ